MVPKKKKTKKKERSKPVKKKEIDLTPPTKYKLVKVLGGYMLEISMYIREEDIPPEDDFFWDDNWDDKENIR